MPFPHRELTEREQLLMGSIRDHVMDHYAPLKNALQTTHAQATDPDAANKLRIELSDLDVDLALDTEELAFLAGQRDGFLAGVQFICRHLQAGLGDVGADIPIDVMLQQATENGRGG